MLPLAGWLSASSWLGLIDESWPQTVASIVPDLHGPLSFFRRGCRELTSKPQSN
jgi:hypothetical protein